MRIGVASGGFDNGLTPMAQALSGEFVRGVRYGGLVSRRVRCRPFCPKENRHVFLPLWGGKGSHVSADLELGNIVPSVFALVLALKLVPAIKPHYPTDIPLAAQPDRRRIQYCSFAKARCASGVREFRRRRIQHLAQDPQGLSTSTPIPSKSATFLVATVRPCTRAVAAIRASRSERGLGT